VLFPLNFCLWGWIQGEVDIINIDISDELLARIFDAAACIKKSEDQLRRTTRDFGIGIAKFTEVYGGIFEYLF
jgi:hypothetical protein